MKYYSLYYNKKDKVIKIKLMNERTVNYDKAVSLCTDSQPKYFNDCYYFCSDRKLLKVFAEAMKISWINELKEEMSKVENIRI